MYCVGAEIHDERDFYGRQALLHGLLKGPERAVLVVGLRRTGKSALLLALVRRALHEDALLPVLLPLEGAGNVLELRDAFASALRRLQRSFPGIVLPPLLELRNYPMDVLVQTAQEAAEATRRGLLVLMDGAEALVRLGRDDPAGLGRFRAALPRRPEDRIVLAGARTALALGDGAGSFLSGFAVRPLPPGLDEEGARSLVALQKRKGEGAVQLVRPAVDDLLRRTGSHPYLLQAACDHLRTHGGDVARAVATVTAHRAAVEALTDDLSQLTPSERDVLSLRLRGERVPPDLELYGRSLVDLGVLDGEGALRCPPLADQLRLSGWRPIPVRLDDSAIAPGAAPRHNGHGEVDQGAVRLSGGGLRYRLIRKLGDGGFGQVFLIRLMDSAGFERLAALKVLLGRWERDSELLARIRDEGRLLGRLHHKSIVRVELPVEVEGRFGLVMEYVAGLDLYDILHEQTGPLPARLLGDICAEVAAALDVAYNRIPEEHTEPLRVLHRDIKPANIRLTRDGEVKILDFGIARAEFDAREARADGEELGTPAYFAPERHHGQHDHPGSDVYALALVILEMALGRLPRFPCSDAQEHDTAVGAALDGLRAELAPLRPLLQRMLAWNAQERPTAAEVAAEARAVPLGGESLLSWTSRVLPPLLELRTLPPVAGAARPAVAREGTLLRWGDR